MISVARAAAFPGVVVALFFGATAADFLVSRVAGVTSRLLGSGPSARRADVGLGVSLVLPAVIAFVSIMQLDERTTSGYERSRLLLSSVATLRAAFELPGQPVGLAFRTESEGYVSLAEGEIARFVVPEAGEELQLIPVAKGLQHPRGIAIVDDALFVTELGALP